MPVDEDAVSEVMAVTGAGREDALKALSMAGGDTNEAAAIILDGRLNDDDLAKLAQADEHERPIGEAAAEVAATQAAIESAAAPKNDSNTDNDEEIAKAVEAALRLDDEEREKSNSDAAKLDAAVASMNDPWKQAEDEWACVEERELKDGPPKGKPGFGKGAK